MTGVNCHSIRFSYENVIVENRGWRIANLVKPKITHKFKPNKCAEHNSDYTQISRQMSRKTLKKCGP